jgi:hypothetical protein
MKKLKIETLDGPQGVDLIAYTEFFGIHNAAKGYFTVDEDMWTVTHIPTGRAVGSFMGPMESLEMACRLEGLSIPWDVTSRYELFPYEEIVKEMVQDAGGLFSYTKLTIYRVSRSQDAEGLKWLGGVLRDAPEVT